MVQIPQQTVEKNWQRTTYYYNKYCSYRFQPLGKLIVKNSILSPDKTSFHHFHSLFHIRVYTLAIIYYNSMCKAITSMSWNMTKLMVCKESVIYNHLFYDSCLIQDNNSNELLKYFLNRVLNNSDAFFFNYVFKNMIK